MKGGFTMTEHINNMREICEQRIAAMRKAGIGDENQYQKMRADNEALIAMDIKMMSREQEVIKW